MIVTNINMRTRILLLFLPIAIIPVVVIAILFSMRLYNDLLVQSNKFYGTIIDRVAKNIDYKFNQYAQSFEDLTHVPNYNKIVHKGSFSSMMEELQYLTSIGETTGNPKGNSLYTNFFTKFSGNFYLFAMQTKSLNKQTDYYRYSLSESIIDIDKLINSDFFKSFKYRDGKPSPVYGHLPEGVLDGFRVDELTAFVYPHYDLTDGKLLSLMMVIENPDFISDFYSEIANLQYGTIYILDSSNSILSKNHPSSDDYYLYDEDKQRYILNGDDPYIKELKIGIGDYRQLNTDESILNHSPVSEQIMKIVSNNKADNEKIFLVTHNRQIYLMQAAYAPGSGVSVVYFHPLANVVKPILQTIYGIVLISFLIIAAVAGFSFYLSRYISDPIDLLAARAKSISKGDYSGVINVDKLHGEFLELGNSFNQMSKQIKIYNDNLEGIIQERTFELSETNIKLNEEYEQNHKELMMAQRIQKSLIPKIFPDSSKIMFNGFYLPMEIIGGDLYDVHTISADTVGILMADVCGHGIPASLITAIAKVSFNAAVKEYTSPEAIVESANKEVCEAIQGTGDFLTAFYCVIDLNTLILSYSNAGHNDIYILHEDGEIDELVTNGPVVGVFKDMKFGRKDIQLRANDRLILYTDGIIEAKNHEKMLYSTDRFKKVIVDYRQKSASDFISTLTRDIELFKEAVPHDDDMALLVADIVQDC